MGGKRDAGAVGGAGSAIAAGASAAGWQVPQAGERCMTLAHTRCDAKRTIAARYTQTV